MAELSWKVPPGGCYPLSGEPFYFLPGIVPKPSSLLPCGFYGFFVGKNHKTHDYWAAFGVCKVKNRLIAIFKSCMHKAQQTPSVWNTITLQKSSLF
jgi:hypothetical protein